MAGRINQVVVNLILDGLRRFSPEALPADAELASLAGDDSGVPLEPYRAVLDAVVARAGRVALLRAGRALEDLSDPLLFVLLNSDAVSVLIEKEARLGRFIHSRHVVRVLDETPRSIRLEHVSREPEPPRSTENLASAGQHLVLLEQLGCEGLRLRLPGSDAPERWVYRSGEYVEPAAGNCAEWQFEWERFVPSRRPMAGLDQLLLSGESRPELREAGVTALGVERVVRGDLGRSWTLPGVARRLCTSPRSLQRALSAEGNRFSDLLDQIRVDEARRLLEATALSVTEIGYVCGFADTSHFSRRFKQRLGVSPSEHRSRSEGLRAAAPEAKKGPA